MSRANAEGPQPADGVPSSNAQIGSAARRGRPPVLSRERIVAAAMESDLATLRMRDLARALGVSHAALYRWVPSQEALFHLIGEVVVERVIPPDAPTAETWREWLSTLAHSMYEEFLAVPGFAERVAIPHAHSPESYGALRGKVVSAFEAAGTDAERAEQNWQIYSVSVTTWLAAVERVRRGGGELPPFELFVTALLGGLPI